MSLIVCCMFFNRGPTNFRGRWPVATYWYCFSIPVNPMLLLLATGDHAATKHRGITLPICREAPHHVHQVYQVWHSQICSVCFIKCDFYKSTIHWSPLRLLQVHLKNLHGCVAAVAPCCSESPFISYYSVWLCYTTFKWSCNYATHQQPCYRSEYACRIFICIIEI